MQRQDKSNTLYNNTGGFAVVEATFVFPLMIMIFFALFLLAIYLPQRVMLQRATQMAATAIAVEMSDTWVYYDTDELKYARHASYRDLTRGKGGVYVGLFRSVFGANNENAEDIVNGIDEKENIAAQMRIAGNDTDIEVEYALNNYVVYKEVVVTATRNIPVPFLPQHLSIIRFPGTIKLVVTSTAVVQNGDEFVRSVDMVTDFIDWMRERYDGVDNVFSFVGNIGNGITGFLGVA